VEFEEGKEETPRRFAPRGDVVGVMPSEARHLLFNRKGKLTPFELTP